MLGVNAVSFVAVLAVVLALRPVVAAGPPGHGTLTGATVDAVRLAARSPALRLLLGLFALVAGVFFPVCSVLLPVLARERGWSAVDVGWILGAEGAGALAVAIVVARTGTSRRVGPAAAGGAVAMAGAVAGLAGAPSVGGAVAAGALLGVGLSVFLCHVSPLIVTLSPDTHLGRVQALVGLVQSAVLVGTNLLLGLVAGVAGAVAGLAAAGGGFVVAAGLAVWLGRVAEADGNRTRLAEMLGHVGVEDRGGHQAP